MPQDSWYVRPTRDKSLPAHDRGLTYAAYHTEKPFVFEVFDGQGNITGVGPWYRRDRHEHYAKGSRVKNPGENNPSAIPDIECRFSPQCAEGLTKKRQISISSARGAASPPEEDSVLRQLHTDIYQFLSDLYRM